MERDTDIQAVDDFMSYCERVVPDWTERCVGAPLDAVHHVEAAAPAPLPPEYRQFLLRMGATPPGTLGGFLEGHAFGVEAALQFYTDPPIPVPADAVYFATMNEDFELFLPLEKRGAYRPLLNLSWQRSPDYDEYDLSTRAEFVVASSLMEHLYRRALHHLCAPSLGHHTQLREPWKVGKTEAMALQSRGVFEALAQRLGFAQVPFMVTDVIAYECPGALLRLSSQEVAQDTVSIDARDARELGRLSELFSDALGLRPWP